MPKIPDMFNTSEINVRKLKKTSFLFALVVIVSCYFPYGEFFCYAVTQLPSVVVAKSVLPVRNAPRNTSEEAFRLFPGMDFTPLKSVVYEGVAWYKIKVGGRNYWVQVESSGNGTKNAATKEAWPFKETGSNPVGNHVPVTDDKIVVDKATRTMSVFEGEGDTWKLKKVYDIGLGFGAGRNAGIKPVKGKKLDYLIITESGKIRVASHVSSGDLHGAGAVVKADRKTNTLTVYYPSSEALGGSLGTGEKYPIDRRVIIGSFAVWFDYDHFNAILNVDISAKEKAMDNRTPEGLYYVAKIITKSDYGTDPDTGGAVPSLLLSYPNQYDALRGLKKGLIGVSEYVKITRAIEDGAVPPQYTRLGNHIEIHGGGNTDWTAGCIALGNGDFKDLLHYVYQGMAVEIM